MGRRAYSVAFASLASAIASCLIPFLHPGTAAGADLDYYQAFSLLVRSNVHFYGQFPLHNPWFNGGMDLLANPQSWVFSPLVLFDLFLPPHWAVISQLFVLAFVGNWGAYRLFRSFKVSHRNALVAAACFVNSGWFGLHFAEGHITYASFQLLPWVYYLGLKSRSPRAFFWLVSAVAFCLLSGGIYPFTFSLLLLFSLALTGQLGILRKSAWRRVGRLHLLSVAAVALLAAAKMIPVLTFFRDRVPYVDFVAIPASDLPRIFLDPFHSPGDLVPYAYFRFHEVGCFIGVTVLIIAAMGAAMGAERGTSIAAARKTVLPVLGVIALWFWTGSGWVESLNPWRLFASVPLLNNVHLQSRLFILSFLGIGILFARGLQRLEARCPSFTLLSLLLLVQAGIARSFPAYETYSTGGRPVATQTEIHGIRLQKTLETAWGSEHLLDGTLGSAATYDPAAPKSQVRHSQDPAYRGEAYLTAGSGWVELNAYYPGVIRLGYEAGSAATAEINTNFLDGWKLDPDSAPGAQVFRTGRGLVGVRLSRGSGTAIIQYAPAYLDKTLLCLLLGYALWFYLAFTPELRAKPVTNRKRAPASLIRATT